MYFVRPSEVEVDAWKDMIAPDDASSAEVWGWSSFFQAMKKSETFTPPKPDIQAMANINFQADSMGTNGPMHVSYPGL
jgi:choline dehydrogenase